MSVFWAYVLKPFILVVLFGTAAIIAWPIHKWLHKKMKPGKWKDKLLTRI